MNTSWRIIPPGGAPIDLNILKRGRQASGEGEFAVEEIRRAFTRFHGGGQVFLFGSGRAALAALFSALRRISPDRDEVVIPAYASYSLPAAVVRAGCRARLYDLNPRTLAPDLVSVKKAFSGRVLAVVTAHLFGCPFNTDQLKALCRTHGATLVDDAAQALGASVDGKMAGTGGDAGLFSLGRAKCITTVNGGVLAVKNERIIQELDSTFIAHIPLAPDRLIALKALGLWLLRRPEFYRLPASLPWLRLGASIFDPNFTFRRFMPFQAGMALAAMEKLHETNQARVKKASFYLSNLPNCWRAVEPVNGASPIYTRFPVLPAQGHRTNLSGAAVSALKNLGVSRGYPLALADLPELVPHLATRTDCPGARLLAAHLITLPTHDHVRVTDCRIIVKKLEEIRP